MTNHVFILHGPNLNLLGTREPEIYGARTLEDIMAACTQEAELLSLTVHSKQSNDEGAMVSFIQEEQYDGIVINAAAYTHTSVAIRDALRAMNKPVIEVHLSNIHKREEFRHHSYIAPIAQGVICGFGAESYLLALRGMASLL
jgi:3-dehydroquinate dehydratase-2